MMFFELPKDLDGYVGISFSLDDCIYIEEALCSTDSPFVQLVQRSPTVERDAAIASARDRRAEMQVTHNAERRGLEVICAKPIPEAIYDILECVVRWTDTVDCQMMIAKEAADGEPLEGIHYMMAMDHAPVAKRGFQDIIEAIRGIDTEHA